MHAVDLLLTRFLRFYAKLIANAPHWVLLALLILILGSVMQVPHLHLNTNQLDLLPPELPEVQAVKQLIDSYGGSGYLVCAFRTRNIPLAKQVIDDLALMIASDHERIREVTIQQPIQFMQEHIALLLEPNDVRQLKTRIVGEVKQLIRQQSPLYLDLGQKPPSFDFTNWLQQQQQIGKKNLTDPYLLSADRQMLLMLIKPQWDSNHLGDTAKLVESLHQLFQQYSKTNTHAAILREDYSAVGDGNMIAYGLTGSYKGTLDDSFAMVASLRPVGLWAFAGIVLVTVSFFRGRIIASLLVLTGMVIGTLLTMGFCAVTLREVNVITSVLAAILMGFGVDYGIHFMFRLRLELQHQTLKNAISQTLIGAGRPALVSALVTAGAFYVLLMAQFRGFSRFGFLAGSGTLIIALTMFSWCGAVCTLLQWWSPQFLTRCIQAPPPNLGWRRCCVVIDKIPRCWRRRVWFIAYAVVVVTVILAIPWAPHQPYCIAPQVPQTLIEKLHCGVRFNYNSKALAASHKDSQRLQDEINQRFHMGSDPVVVLSPTLAHAEQLLLGLKNHPERYDTFDEVVSLLTFVPSAQRAQENSHILKGLQQDLNDLGFTWEMLPESMTKQKALLQKIIAAKPYTVADLPAALTARFHSLATAQPVNQGYLTFIYPRIDLGNGQDLWRFAKQAMHIQNNDGTISQAAGLPLLYARLAKMVLDDGKLTLVLAAIWILVLHYLDFRSWFLALISILPLGVGLVMMLGLLNWVGSSLNFMNIIMLPILLGFGVSHGLYLLHRFLEGMTGWQALRSVGVAVCASTLTAVAGFAALFAAEHQGLRSMGLLACLGLCTTLWVSFTVFAKCLEWLDKRRCSQDRHR